jgi:hypothetical protein
MANKKENAFITTAVQSAKAGGVWAKMPAFT